MYSYPRVAPAEGGSYGASLLLINSYPGMDADRHNQ